RRGSQALNAEGSRRGSQDSNAEGSRRGSQDSNAEGSRRGSQALNAEGSGSSQASADTQADIVSNASDMDLEGSTPLPKKKSDKKVQFGETQQYSLDTESSGVKKFDNTTKQTNSSASSNNNPNFIIGEERKGSGSEIPSPVVFKKNTQKGTASPNINEVEQEAMRNRTVSQRFNDASYKGGGGMSKG
ncbi:MAG: hypothetical protein ACJAW3_001162, partial [Lentimonas sp.]